MNSLASLVGKPVRFRFHLTKAGLLILVTPIRTAPVTGILEGAGPVTPVSRTNPEFDPGHRPWRGVNSKGPGMSRFQATRLREHLMRRSIRVMGIRIPATRFHPLPTSFALECPHAPLPSGRFSRPLRRVSTLAGAAEPRRRAPRHPRRRCHDPGRRRTLHRARRRTRRHLVYVPTSMEGDPATGPDSIPSISGPKPSAAPPCCTPRSPRGRYRRLHRPPPHRHRDLVFRRAPVADDGRLPRHPGRLGIHRSLPSRGVIGGSSAGATVQAPSSCAARPRATTS